MYTFWGRFLYRIFVFVFDVNMFIYLLNLLNFESKTLLMHFHTCDSPISFFCCSDSMLFVKHIGLPCRNTFTFIFVCVCVCVCVGDCVFDQLFDELIYFWGT